MSRAPERAALATADAHIDEDAIAVTQVFERCRAAELSAPTRPSQWEPTVIDARSPWYDAENEAEALLSRYDREHAPPALAPMIALPIIRPLPSPGTVIGPAPVPPPAPDRTRAEPAKPTTPVAELHRSQLPKANHWLRTMWKGERLMHYNRLIAISLAVNALLLVLGLTQSWFAGDVRNSVDVLGKLVLGNFAVAILIRQHHMINLLFWLATRAPTSWPLPIRATLAKVYHFGGIHVGTAIAGTAWYISLLGVLLAHRSDPLLDLAPAAKIVVVAQSMVLLVLCWTSRRSFRMKHHDVFEMCKRFGGWTSLVLFWAYTVLTTNDHLGAGASLADTLADAPTTWVLGVITLSVALPWLRLRRVPVAITTPSSHVAIARFDYGVTPFAGSSTSISRHPLKDWHAFANIPSPGRTGFRLAISRAGDWTGSLIEDKPSHVWVKAIPTAGVANIEVLFKKVVYIATGSGIGPCLPHLLANKVPARLVWATRDPRKTYGNELVDEILAEHPDAIIWDTDLHGKPDMVELAYRAARDFDAEAVICISNKKLTWRVVSWMESRGVPAYGAIWDS